jgi:N-acetylglucosaminyldiphosphoundecaprenol N-acetyl-beta-D-mannosaminyltransferase
MSTINDERPRITFMEITFDDVTMRQSLRLIDGFVKSRSPHKVFSVNVACLIESRDDASMRSFYKTCDLLMVDGMGILYAGKLLGFPFRETVATSYLTLELLRVSVETQYRIYLLGSKPEYLKEALQTIDTRYPGIQIVGSHHGYFSKDEEPLIVEQIANLNPDILLIGISSPLKERFVSRNFDSLNTPVQIGVGGMIDILAGVTRLPPPWIRKLGLEWVNRLRQEPRRLAKRYLRTNIAFAGLVFREGIRRRLLGSAQ